MSKAVEAGREFGKSPFLCIGVNVWGRGFSIDEARRNAHNSGAKVVYFLPPEIRESVEVNEIDGGLSWIAAEDEHGSRIAPIVVHESPEYVRARLAAARRRLGIKHLKHELEVV